MRACRRISLAILDIQIACFGYISFISFIAPRHVSPCHMPDTGEMEDSKRLRCATYRLSNLGFGLEKAPFFHTSSASAAIFVL